MRVYKATYKDRTGKQRKSAKWYSKDYFVRSRNRLKKIVSTCRITYFRDITKSAVEIYSGRMKKDGYGDTSRGHYLDALKTFLNWQRQIKGLSAIPLQRWTSPSVILRKREY